MNADGIPAGQYVATFSWMDTGGAAPNPNQPPIPGITALDQVKKIPAMIPVSRIAVAKTMGCMLISMVLF